MTHKEHILLNKQIESFKINYPFYEEIGAIFMDPDTANVYILTKDGQRFMITSEYVELMNPTKECFQLGINKLKNNQQV